MSTSNDTLPKRTKSRFTKRHDSSRWDHYSPREGDVIIATYPKCGTTWMEHIVVNLLHSDGDVPLVMDVSPWIELRLRRDTQDVEIPIKEVMSDFDKQTHRRMMKTHLPLNCLPYHPPAMYIVVARDARDACMSFFNHVKALGSIEEGQDIRQYWAEWIANAANEDTVAHPLFDFYQQWWDFRHLKNVLLVHFSDLKTDPVKEISRLAQFLGIEPDEELVNDVREATDFSTMKANAGKLLPGLVDRFKEDGRSFINEGTNGRWRESLTEDDLRLYEPVASRSASLDCRKWIEQGRTPLA